ncbi:MAG: helix-turn-helix transcriptional regulator [Bradymonadia bacterium]
MYTALDAERPLETLVAALAKAVEGSVVSLWSRDVSLCWATEYLPRAVVETILTLPLGVVNAFDSHGISRDNGAWVVMPLTAEAPSAVVWHRGLKGVECIEQLYTLFGAHVGRILDGIAARQRRAEVTRYLDTLQIPMFKGFSGRLMPFNDAAQVLMAQGEGIKVQGQWAQVIDVVAEVTLRQQIERVMHARQPSVTAVEIPRAGHSRSLWALVMRGRDLKACWVLVHDPSRPWWGELPPGLYELSPAERAVVQWTLKGYSAPEVAEELKVSPWTVRSHLKRAFVKTGTHRQSELVALLAPVMMWTSAKG